MTAGTWKVTRVAANFAKNVVVDSGILVRNFDIENPVKPADADIICATTGDFTITDTVDTENFFEDVNGVIGRPKEGQQITGRTNELGLTCLEVTAATLKLALGAADVGEDGGVHTRGYFKAADFQSLAWLADMVDEEKLFAVVMENTVSTGGLSMTATKASKGQISLTLGAFTTLAAPDEMPMAYYILEKVAPTTTP